MNKPVAAPPPRVLERAARERLGEFEERVRRRPGIGGAVGCLVTGVVVMNLLRNLPGNGWALAASALGLLGIGTWVYISVQRTRGGLYLFSDGFIDAGSFMTVMRWSQVRSVKGAETIYHIGSIPVGRGFTYHVGYVTPASENAFVWDVNTTYRDVHAIAQHVSERSGVPVLGRISPGTYLPAEEAGGVEGTVTSFDVEEGHGWIRPDAWPPALAPRARSGRSHGETAPESRASEEIYFDYSEVQTFGGETGGLDVGQRVTFGITWGVKGPQATTIILQ